MKKGEVTITLVDHRSGPATFLRFVFCALPFCAILIGVLVGSLAMQWMGFLLSIMVMVSVVASHIKRNTGLTIAQAKERLAELEANYK